MRKVYCDSCGKEIHHEPFGSGGWSQFAFCAGNRRITFSGNIEVWQESVRPYAWVDSGGDLCRDCYRDEINTIVKGDLLVKRFAADHPRGHWVKYIG